MITDQSRNSHRKQSANKLERKDPSSDTKIPSQRGNNRKFTDLQSGLQKEKKQTEFPIKTLMDLLNLSQNKPEYKSNEDLP